MRNIVALILCALLLSGCALRLEYLNPIGAGKVFQLGNPCPYEYRVLEVRSKIDPNLRINVSAPWKGEFGLKQTTLFVVIADRKVPGYQVTANFTPSLRKTRGIEFPNGTKVKITRAADDVVEGNFVRSENSAVIKETLILSFPVSDTKISAFSVTLPSIRIDGELFDLGTIKFKRQTETMYILNC